MCISRRYLFGPCSAENANAGTIWQQYNLQMVAIFGYFISPSARGCQIRFRDGRQAGHGNEGGLFV